MKNRVFYCFWILASLALGYRANASDCSHGKVELFQKQSVKMDKSSVDSVLKLAENFQKEAADQTAPCREAMFQSFYKFYGEAAAAKSEAVSAMGTQSEEAKKKLEQEISRVGWKITEAEGYLHLVADPAWAKEKFGSLLPDAWNEYFLLKKQEFNEAVPLKWSVLAKQIGAWETFLKKHAQFLEKEEIEGYLNLHIQDLLTGSGARSLFNEGEKNAGKLKDDAKKAYEDFIQSQKDSRYHGVVKGYYEKLKGNGFKWAKDCETYLNSHGIMTVPGMVGGGN